MGEEESPLCISGMLGSEDRKCIEKMKEKKDKGGGSEG